MNNNLYTETIRRIAFLEIELQEKHNLLEELKRRKILFEKTMSNPDMSAQYIFKARSKAIENELLKLPKGI